MEEQVRVLGITAAIQYLRQLPLLVVAVEVATVQYIPEVMVVLVAVLEKAQTKVPVLPVKVMLAVLPTTQEFITALEAAAVQVR
jgi:hypothetical protein